MMCLQRLSRHWRADYRLALMHNTYPLFAFADTILHVLVTAAQLWQANGAFIIR